MMLKLKQPMNPTLRLLSEIRPPVRIKKILANPSLLVELFPMQLAQMSDEQTREYHLKKFAEWGKKWEQEQKAELVYGVDGKIYRNGKLLAERPNYEQNQWYERRMKGNARSWEVWDK